MKPTNCDAGEGDDPRVGDEPRGGLDDPRGITLMVPDLYSRFLLAFCTTYLRRWLSLSASKSVATTDTTTSASSPSRLSSKLLGSFLYKQKFLGEVEFELGVGC